MRVLLDRHLPYRLRQHFAAPIEVVTVGYQGWKGIKNGELLRKVSSEFDAFITTDKGFLYQQNLEKIQMGIVLYPINGICSARSLCLATVCYIKRRRIKLIWYYWMLRVTATHISHR